MPQCNVSVPGFFPAWSKFTTSTAPAFCSWVLPNLCCVGLDIHVQWGEQGEERRDRRKVQELRTVQMGTHLTTALGLLLEDGISCLPVVDEV